MQIVVTGGAGFLGKHLCRALHQAGHEVSVIDLKLNPEFPTIIADVQDAVALKRGLRGADFVFHLASLIEAGESVEQPQRYVDVNISATVTLLETMRQLDIRQFAFSSSAAIYGEPQQVPIVEDSRTLPINPYGMTKLAMEGLLSSYVANFGFTGAALRYFNLYGPEENHQPETHAIPRFIRQIHQGEEVTIWGSGEHQRDFIHVADVVTAHLNIIDLCRQQPQRYHYFNVSTEQPTKVITVIKLLEEIMGQKANITHFPDRPGDPLVLTASAAKARAELGWSATVDLRQGLTETVEYFRQQWLLEK